MKRLPIILLIVTMLLTGCIGAERPVYDGSPTALNVVVKRNTVQALAEGEPENTVQALAEGEPEEGEPEVVKVRIWKTNEQGQVIYSVMRDVPLDEIVSAEEGYTLSEVVPADKKYKVTAFYVQEGTFEIDETTVNVPADKVTTTNLTLKDLSYLLDVPEKVYSGGSTEQFKLLPSEFEDVLHYQVYLALAPWNGNGNNRVPYLEWLAWSTTSWKGANRFFPEVSEPTKLYYQFSITYNAQVYNPFAYFPNLASGEELPYIWLLPSPDWEDQQ